MNIYQRFGYYLGGFAIGLIILAFFLSGKRTSCDYGPSARTVKNISSKPIFYSAQAQNTINKNQLDSLTILNLIKYGEVDFSMSNTKQEPCKVYTIFNAFKEQPIKLVIENCDSLATLNTIEYIKP
ncbi:MAG: DUF4258 domain-containing protein [Winogradskyella sp.]|nr:hypothetical protein [Bacteroidia bacterium]NNC44658.1 DUF4258 domain-containing protein [Winogradskyella sp.]